MKGSMTSLVAFGCSHTDPADNLPRPWPERIGDITGWKIENYGMSGASNDFIFRTTMKYLAQGHRPDYLIVQLTELKRFMLPVRDRMETYWSTPDLNFQLWRSCRQSAKQRHPEFLPEQEMALIYVWNIQQMCAQLGVVCRFISFSDLSKIPDSPMWNHIDRSSFLHENPHNGWLNHVWWKFGELGIIQPPNPEDNPSWGRIRATNHMTDIAIDYTVECWLNYLETGKQIVIEEENYLEVHKMKPLVYRYTEEENNV